MATEDNAILFYIVTQRKVFTHVVKFPELPEAKKRTSITGLREHLRTDKIKQESIKQHRGICTFKPVKR